MADKRDGNTELLDNLILVAKNHYGHELDATEAALKVFQRWTGTPKSTWKDLWSVILPLALALPHFKQLSEHRLAIFITELIQTPHERIFGYQREENPYRRAVSSLMSEFGSMMGIHWLAERVCPKPDPELAEYLKPQEARHEVPDSVSQSA